MEIYLIIGIYLALTLATGLIGYRKSKNTPDDYFLAGRGIGPVIMFFTLIATNFSAFFFLGFAGAGYRIGYSYYIMMAVGTSFAALSFFFIGDKTWRLGKEKGYITPAEMVGDLTGSKVLRVLVVVVMVCFTLPYMAIQPLGAGYIIAEITGGEVSETLGAIMLTVFIVIYVYMGGMRSIAITDMIQGILMFGFMITAVWIISDDLGGLKAANTLVFEMKPELFSREGGGEYFTPQKWFSFMLFWFLCVPMFPQMFMRFFISETRGGLKTASVLYALVPLVLFICPVIIGVLGHLSFPDLEGKSSDQILPMMLSAHASKGLAAVILTGAFAAFMSTMDSQLIAVSTMLTRDLYIPIAGKEPDFRRQVMIGRVLIPILAVSALGVAFLASRETIFLIAKNAFSGFAILFPAVASILYMKNVHVGTVIGSIIIGEGLLLGVMLEVIPKDWLLGFEPAILIVGLCAVMIALGTLVFGKTKFGDAEN